jgi:hypothetical protein
VQLIASTKTGNGLEVEAELDTGCNPTKIKVADAELAAVRLSKSSFHDEWNYTIKPTQCIA